MSDLPDISNVWGQTLRDLTSPEADVQRQNALLLQKQNRLADLQYQYQAALPAALGATMGGGSAPSGGGSDSDSGFGDVEVGSNAHGSQPASASDESSGVSLNPAASLHNFQARYAPIPSSIPYSPQEQQALAMAALSKNQEAVDLIKARHQMQIDGINQSRATQAQQHYNGLVGIATAPDGRALDALALMDPKQAERLRGMGLSDNQVRNYAAQMAGQLHVGAQLGVEFKDDGTARDKATGRDIPGYDAAVGLGPKERVELTKASTERVDGYVDGVAAKVPRYKSEGYDTPAAWVQDHAQMAAKLQAGLPVGSPAAAAPVTAAGATSPQVPNSAPQATSSAGAAPTVPWLRPQPTAQPAPASNQAQQKPWKQPQGPLQDWRTLNADPKVFSDPEFRLQTPKIPAGQAMPPAVQDEQKAIAKSRTDLLQEQSDNTKAAGQALRYYSLATDVLNTGNVTTGWSQEHINGMAAALQQVGIPTAWLGDPAKSAELVKALTNAGLNNIKATFGKTTQNEVFLQLSHASPNADMPLPALRRLINDQTQNLIYDIHSSDRANKYLAAGNDPRKFDTWNQRYFPREKDAVTPQPSNSNKPPQAAAVKPDSGGFIPGRLYPGANGAKARYMGNGQWQVQ